MEGQSLCLLMKLGNLMTLVYSTTVMDSREVIQPMLTLQHTLILTLWAALEEPIQILSSSLVPEIQENALEQKQLIKLPLWCWSHSADILSFHEDHWRHQKNQNSSIMYNILYIFCFDNHRLKDLSTPKLFEMKRIFTIEMK